MNDFSGQFFLVISSFAIGAGTGLLIARALMVEGATLRGSPTITPRPPTRFLSSPSPPVDDEDDTRPAHTRARLWTAAPDTLPPDARGTISFPFSNPDGTRREIVIARRTLEKFVRCPTPSRSEWSGKSLEYGRAAALAQRLRWVSVEDGRGGMKWAIGLHEYTRTSKYHRRLIEISERHHVQL